MPAHSALEPDDENEGESAPAERGEEPREVARAEGPDAEEREIEERLRDPAFDPYEQHQQGQAATDHGDHEGVGPAHRLAAVGLDTVGNPDQKRRQTHGEGQVAGPVDLRVADRAQFFEAHVRPDRADQPDGHADEEHQPPVDRRQDAAHDEPDELAGQEGDAVDAEGQAPLLGRECVGQDGLRVRKQKRAADPLYEAHADDPDRPGRSGEWRQGEKQRSDGEDDEARVIHADSPEHVTEAPERHNEHGGHEQVAHHDPEEIARAARVERVQLDAVEDRGQRDDHDRAVDRRHQDPERRVREGDPFVVRVVPAGAAAALAVDGAGFGLSARGRRQRGEHPFPLTSPGAGTGGRRSGAARRART
jgi:hypothetical protein